MSGERKISHGFKLRIAGGSGPTIFFWPILPESIQAVHALDSGGAKVTIKLPNGDKITHAVVESKEEIEGRVARCKELDEKCQDGEHIS